MHRLVLAVDLASPSVHVRPEWPPSPSRLTGALVAGGYGRGLDPDAMARAMRVLESLPAPSVRVPGRLGRPSDVRVAVPHNQAEVALREVRAGRAPTLDGAMAVHKDLRLWRETLLDGTRIQYSYPVPDAALDDVRAVMDDMSALARSVHAFCRSMDPACCSVALVEGPLPDAQAWWRPAEAAATVLRVPTRGAHDECVAIHPVGADVDDGGVTFVASATRWRETPYAAPGEPVGTPSMALTMTALDGAGRLASFGAADRAALSRAVAEAPLPKGVAVLPLPSVGGDHADGRVRRLLVIAPDHDALDGARYALAGRVITVEVGDDAHDVILEVAPNGSSVVKHYVPGGRSATTVVPALLRAPRDADAAALCDAAVASLPEDLRSLVTDCDVRRDPFEPWGAKVSGTGPDGTHRRHVGLRFARDVRGPLLVGERTGSGHGLMRLHEAVTTRRYLLSGRGLPRVADAVRVTDAFRAAALRRADDLGLRISPALTGHGPDGRPLRTEDGAMHPHAHWLVETDDMPDAARGCVSAVVVHAPMGLSPDDLAALDAVARLWTREVTTCPRGGWTVAPDRDGASCLVRSATEWWSVTPHLSTTAEEGRTMLALGRSLERRYGFERDTVTVREERVDGRSLGPAMLGCARGTRNRILDRVGAYYAVTFPEARGGPVLTGAMAHWGMGLFAPVTR